MSNRGSDKVTPIEIESLAIEDVKIISPTRLDDERGFFSETYVKSRFFDAGISVEFVQDNHSMSAAAGTLRGLHYQSQPFAQDKLLRVVRGRIFDVAVDIRRSSPTFGKWVSAEISAKDWRQIFIPVGFAHGFCTLEPDTEVIYKVSNYYSPQHDLGIRWNDPDIGISWPFPDDRMRLSDKDRCQPLLRDVSGFV